MKDVLEDGQKLSERHRGNAKVALQSVHLWLGWRVGGVVEIWR